MIKDNENYEYKFNFDASFIGKKEQIEKQIKNNACNLIINMETKGVGFLCNIPYESKLIPMFIFTISDEINGWINQNNNLSIYYYDEVIEIKNVKIRRQFEIEKLKFIEIKPNHDKIKTRNILELDDDNKDTDNKNEYMINTSIENENKLINFNISNNEFKNEINKVHSSSIIFSSDNFKVIGVKDSTIIKFNKELIDDYISNKINIASTPNYMTLKYRIDKTKKGIRLFGTNFVKKNKNNIKLIINGKEIEFCNYLTIDRVSEFIEKEQKLLEIKLEEKKENSITDFSCMFCWCLQLYEIDIEWKTSHIKDMNHMFCGCESLTYINGISQFNTKNTKYMNEMFYNCKYLEYLPDLSNWDIKNVINMSRMFCGCKSLKLLPDISNWKTSNITNMSSMFCGCEKLSYLPDISRWDISNVTNTNMMFFECKSLKKLPDISNWNTSKVTNMSQMFSFCLSLEYLPDISKWNVENVMFLNDIFKGCENLMMISRDISKWNTSNVINLSGIFSGCKSLQIWPNLQDSWWNTKNVTDISYMFYQCNLLKELPDISKWDISKVTNMSYMFYECRELETLPDIPKWITKNVIDMSYMFFGCIVLAHVPDISNWDLSSKPKKTKIFYEIPLSSISHINQEKFLDI